MAQRHVADETCGGAQQPVPGGILQVIPNGVDLTRFQPVPEGERALIRTTRPRMLPVR